MDIIRLDAVSASWSNSIISLKGQNGYARTRVNQSFQWNRGLRVGEGHDQVGFVVDSGFADCALIPNIVTAEFVNSKAKALRKVTINHNLRVVLHVDAVNVHNHWYWAHSL